MPFQRLEIQTFHRGDAPGPPYNGVVTYWTTSEIIWAPLINGKVECGHYCAYYTVVMEIVWKQAPAISKRKKCLFLLYQVTFIVMHRYGYF